jgi:CTP:molybdopterin cytidylyltransferase MocA
MASGVLGGAVAVIPPRATGITWQLEVAGIRQAENPTPETGVAGSIQVGLAALQSETSPAAQAALILLADQPLVRMEVVRRLVAVWRGSGKSVRPRYAGSPDVPGHPVLLDRSLWTLASRLTADRGLGPVLAERPDWCEVVEVQGTNPDIDTPDDLTATEESRG